MHLVELGDASLEDLLSATYMSTVRNRVASNH